MIAKNCNFFHPWHSISFGPNAPHEVTTIVEITQGSKAKYELDKETGFLRLDRILSTDLNYPFHYGYIPQTYCDDHDPLDVVILCSEKLVPLSIVEIKVLGAIEMIDQGEQDDKIIGIIPSDPLMKHLNDLSEINPDILNSLKHFFEEYKKREGKSVEVKKFLNKAQAQQIILQSIELYKQTFNTK